MKIAIAAFAKTVGYSPVKTRLAAERGAPFAETFYEKSVRATEGVLKEVCASREHAISAYWAIAEAEATESACWEQFPAIWTGEGGLGQRLASIYGRLLETHDAVILIGTDSPQLSPNRFFEAIELMCSAPNDCIIGPAVDGGFYLFGSSRRIEPAIWSSVTYSSETTRQQLIERFSENDIHCRHLANEVDADTGESLILLRQALAKRSDDLLPAQKELQDWLESEA